MSIVMQKANRRHGPVLRRLWKTLRRPLRTLRRSLQALKEPGMSKTTPPLDTKALGRTQAGAGARQTTGAEKITGNEQTGENGNFAPWHPVPVRLVDAVMPHLKDTELRVLLVVLRQTWGWKVDRTSVYKDEAGTQSRTSGQASSQQRVKHQATKCRDWLSHSQLCRRTGRGSDAVSAAVASLTASGLIIVEDAGGKPLATPEERRRCMGRLYFRPGTLWLQ